MHWSVVCGNLNNAWMLKASFVCAYVRTITILTSLHFKNDDILHTGSNYDFNSFEFGEASRSKCTKNCRGKLKTTSWVSFVFSCKMSDEASGILCLKTILDKVAWAMKC